MSISEQVKELRIAEETFRQIGKKGIARFLQEAADTIEALSQKLALVTPKRPLKYEEHEDYDEGICPICGEPVCHVYSYCPGCGQRLKWGSDTEESEVANMERSAEDCGGGWIPCEDRLPEEKGWYLVYAKNQRPFVAYFKGKTFPLNNYYHEIVAWQPLPEPYEP